MSWRKVLPMEERIRFVLKEQEKIYSMTELCRFFGVSRKTGYKWLNRYEAFGLEGLRERSNRPLSCPHETSLKVQRLVVAERLKHPTWGPKKTRERLRGKTGNHRLPAASTIGRILDKAGLVRKKRRRRRRTFIPKGHLTEPCRPNQVWAVDFKGWFRTGDVRRCEPLTVSDLYSRYVLACEALPSQRHDEVEPVFKRLFTQYGLPEVIRSDNGPPFASRGAAGLSRLSVWWVLLGIMPELIDPGHPEQNGIHERMHRTLKSETAKPPAANRRAQQRKFNRWREEFNTERPHEALKMDTPARFYEPSCREYTRTVREPEYPENCHVRRVRNNGEIKWKSRKRFIGESLIKHLVGIVEVEEGRQNVYFGPILLGRLYDRDEGGLRPAAFIPKGR